MAAQGTNVECKFEKLFTRNVPHILEKIFFSLDYASFKKCMEVAPVWRELLTSKSSKRLEVVTFREDIEKELWHNILEGNANEVKRILSSVMVDINCIDRQLATIEEGADVGIRQVELAAFRGNHCMAKLFIGEITNANVQDENGGNALHYAASAFARCNIDTDEFKDYRQTLVEFLIDAGALAYLNMRLQSPLIYIHVCGFGRLELHIIPPQSAWIEKVVVLRSQLI